MIAAEELLLKAVVSALRNHGPVVWNLANEPDLVVIPNFEEAEKWICRMVKTIRDLDPINPITCGFHAPSLREAGNGFQVQLFKHLSVPVNHAYPMYAAVRWKMIFFF